MKAFPIFSAFLIFAIILYSSFMRFCLLPESSPADGAVISSLLQEYDTGWVIEKEEIIGGYPKSDERKAYWIKDQQAKGDGYIPFSATITLSPYENKGVNQFTFSGLPYTNKDSVDNEDISKCFSVFTRLISATMDDSKVYEAFVHDVNENRFEITNKDKVFYLWHKKIDGVRFMVNFMETPDSSGQPSYEVQQIIAMDNSSYVYGYAYEKYHVDKKLISSFVHN